MARCRVSCCDPDDDDDDRRIQGIGGRGGNGWYRKIDHAIRDIENGTNEFYVKVDGEEVDVVVRKRSNGVKYLTTEGDGFPPNNLLNLPVCP